MRAAFYDQTGPARQVLQVAELPDPVPGAGELRVRLQWSGVNPSDVKARAGLRAGGMPFPRIIPHSDGMGIVDAVGPGVSASRIGERVWLWNAAWGRACGTAAQFITLPQAQAVALADSISGEAGACLGIPATTALHALLTHGGVAGKSVLVAGGAGAVGRYAVQFAKLLGARQVITTVSNAAKAELARDAGADRVIDYRTEDVAAQVAAATGGQGVDRIVEVDVAANAVMDIGLVRPGGEWIIYGSGTPQFALPFFALAARNITLRVILVYTLDEAERRAVIDTLTRLLATGRVRHHIAERMPLAQIADAHTRIEQGQVVGNIVLALD
ncbi:NADPH:quinone reductase [Methyloversatilis sp.]|uniref:NADPH:quinone reductase n=1 Tax=Methyloversatilis sp. TaxID=2569862 RepID=UPI002734B37D|nr:NADPH:quinone reductase [Methyloversatilis sp.]MDP2868432.1 NADPH:quinone reductase [Methyloversatilis sp.]MDP3454694.1 NADPH:quinone reductase [Methyloversatilis sp.]MDP3579302.1 NADPH:quinone reductase [Methyloversatilis sp.]